MYGFCIRRYMCSSVGVIGISPGSQPLCLPRPQQSRTLDALLDIPARAPSRSDKQHPARMYHGLLRPNEWGHSGWVVASTLVGIGLFL
jgi:hypothetical protein